MERLPVEVLSQIVGCLNFCDQLQLAKVCVRWRAAVRDCLQRRQRLTAGDLKGKRCTDTLLRTLLPQLPALRALRVAGYDLDIDIVSEHCRRLEEVDLSPFRLSEDALERLCQHCPRLSSVKLPESCEPLWPELVLRRLPDLRDLRLEHVHLTAATVTLLPAGLERLSLYACQVPCGPRQPADRWPRLTELVLTLASVDLDGDLTALLAGCPSLRRLQANCADATDQLLKELPGLKQLQTLDLSFCDDLTEAALVESLPRLRQLKSLNLCGVSSVTDTVLCSLAGAESLSELTLGVEVYYQSVDFTMDGLQSLVMSCASLTTVVLMYWEEKDLEAVIRGLSAQLDPERRVTLTIDETMLEQIDESVLPAADSPLRIATFR
ncbi:uncharacterized protein LOC122364518 [Amphibalanus amphitrite]|uniref:uncharacterized protein LOC122364518 n=1 Tax=Amphibalanus amphitrite TaxID=1232801 RepID=UPI001C92770F|nr:uncharacterized protein LOC122364518 [Amphibalanus amphitrite]XP_043190887.1 uncharacterized protein LOC122364518 [Amphibalanus amphitrite]XP_043190888.1 uncharacterized protein LOC122364518 [Amphibalanus amphitrite]XP_043190889.1 uncharacterized protein LOC122364518 [Amphibalanus amphitrite]XP_043190890.1 uncharacterized protein LOC122364518 [Amphibalanus amphitrite]XP_043190891.1 uncharacterized protein LOC122364518 [Amphibalanus amphitrite]XP_043190892.1 uncharacterized protein LOC12236